MNASPKVLMFGWEFPPHNSGGLGVACHGLSRALAQKNIHITFVLPKKIGVSADFLKMVFANTPNINLRAIDSLLSPYITSDDYRKLRSKNTRGIKNVDSIYGWGLLEEVKRYALQARAIAKKESFDVIHAHDWLSFPAGLEAKAVSGKPLVVHVHATEFDRTGGHGVNQQVYKIEHEGMREADRVITVSQFTKDLVVKQYEINPSKIDVVHNGIDTNEYPVAKNDFSDILELKKAGNNIVLFVGRLTLQKGPEYFLRAAKRVLEYSPNTYFIIAGSGDMEHAVIREAACLGMGTRMLFAGFARGDDLNKLYRSADIYVLPSVAEPFGITPLESLLNGTPVLLSKNAGVGEVLSHALKVDFWDTDEMANKIIAVLKHSPLKEHLAYNGARETRGITWHNAAEKCLGIYKKVLGKPNFKLA